VFVGFAVLDPPHVEPRRRIVLAAARGSILAHDGHNDLVPSAVTDTILVFQLFRSGMGDGLRLPKNEDWLESRRDVTPVMYSFVKFVGLIPDSLEEVAHDVEHDLFVAFNLDRDS
jgi:hypothetical protein